MGSSKDNTITSVFQNFLGKSGYHVTKSEGYKPNKIRAENGCEFGNRSMES